MSEAEQAKLGSGCVAALCANKYKPLEALVRNVVESMFDVSQGCQLDARSEPTLFQTLVNLVGASWVEDRAFIRDVKSHCFQAPRSPPTAPDTGTRSSQNRYHHF